MTQKTCLVIGGRGFVGSALAARALELGMRVTVVGREDYASAAGGQFDVVVFAAGNARRYLADRDPVADLDANVAAVYRATQDFGAGRFVLVSSVDVYAEPGRLEATREDAPIDAPGLSTYGFHKRLAELVAMQRASGWLILRLGQMVGPGLRKGPVHDALRGEPLRVSLASRYPFCRTSSVARVAFTLLDGGAGQAIFNVCAANSATLADVLPSRPAVVPGAPTESYAIAVSKAMAHSVLPAAADEVRAFLESTCC